MANKRARARQAERLRRIRVGVAAAIGVVAVVLGLVGLLYGTGADVGGELAEGEHYRVIPGAEAEDARRALEVVEYFSYACVHCRNFDPLIEDWRSTLPEGVRFRRAHVAFNPSTALLARAHVALEQQDALESNHERIFRALHDRNRQFASVEALADYVDGFGIDREAFLGAVRSARVARVVEQNDQAFRDASLVSVPSVTVAGKYAVNMDIGRKQVLEVVDGLVRREREARASVGVGDGG